LANYRTAEVLGHGFGPDLQKPAYTYLKGSLAMAYGEKAREVERSFVFLNLGDQAVRAVLVVFDRLISADPAFRKYWLLHSMEKPEIEGSRITIAPRRRGWQGKLVDQVILPAQADITPVGGLGKEFWVFGKNYPNQVKEDSAEFEIGEWRVEVSPREPAAADHFLNVMQVMDRDAAPLTAFSGRSWPPIPIDVVHSFRRCWPVIPTRCCPLLSFSRNGGQLPRNTGQDPRNRLRRL
jgi:heparin/heparan-sulfate lyase